MCSCKCHNDISIIIIIDSTLKTQQLKLTIFLLFFCKFLQKILSKFKYGIK